MGPNPWANISSKVRDPKNYACPKSLEENFRVLQEIEKRDGKVTI